MKYTTKVLLAAALLSVSCKSELDGKPVAKVAEAKGDVKPATDAKPDAKVEAPAATRTLKADPAASTIGFVGAKITGDHKGDFKTFTGEATVAGTVPQSVKFSIETASVTSDAEDLTTHLKSPDFFDVAKYPAITFASTGVSRSSATSYSVTGNLTMHGVTKPVTLAVTASPPFNHAGGIRRGIEATTSINRKDFGLRWEFPGEGAGVVVGDNIQITINAELVLQPDPNKGG